MNVKPQSHLINILKSTRDHHPNFVLMLGAGASASSGVKLVCDMISEWREVNYKMYKGSSESFDSFLQRSPWHQSPQEYSLLFEMLYDQPSQRREYIESCIKDSKPSWGYIYLVNLLKNHVFNTVFTTNFDDLLNEACYQFSNEMRPIVCAHDSSINSIRITSARPKIIKLHGDFLFDNIKNTIRELESLEQNTKDKFKQFASEYGFIVIGYSGNDRTIMDTLDALLRYDTYFPHGIYWCIKKGTKIVSKTVDLLARFSKFKLIEIEGFDEFFAELNQQLGFKLQPEMADPYSALAAKLNTLIENIKLPEGNIHPIIDKDIKNLGYQIGKSLNTELKKDILNETSNLPIPYGLLSNIRTREKDYDLAFKYRLKELETNPTPNSFVEAFRLLYKASQQSEWKDKLLKMLFNSKELFATHPMSTFDICLTFIENNDFENAEKVLDFGYDISQKNRSVKYFYSFYHLNKLQIKAHRKIKLSSDEKISLQKLLSTNPEDSLTKYGCYILLEDYPNAEEMLKFIRSTNDLSDVAGWPITKLLQPHLKDASLLQPKESKVSKKAS
jgi:hypothetical protein